MLQTLAIKSGVNTLATQTGAKGTWSRSNHIRFRDGFIEKSFGFTTFTDELLTGVPRSLHCYMDSNKNKLLVAGTHRRLELWNAGSLNDITPLRVAAQNIAVAIDTTNGSAVCTVNDTGHGATSGDEVYFITPVAVGGVILYGPYQLTVVDDDNYTVTASSNATSTVTNGGAVPVFDTTNTSPNVVVTLAAHGKIVGESFRIDVTTTVGGLTFTEGAEYPVDAVLSANTFRIVHASDATSTATVSMNSGNVRLEYLLSAGLASTTAAVGWGAGPYGHGAYGEGEVSEVAITLLRIWSLDNFQDNLLASVNDGALYEWVPPVADGNRATAVGGTVPTIMRGMFVTTPQLQVVAFGAEVLGTQDPLLVRWCDAGDYEDWVATATNLAGSYRLSRGSHILAGMQGPQANYIWTDIDFWLMQYVGLPNVYNFQLIATGCGILGQKAMAQVGKTVYWASHKGFFKFDGSGVRPIPCTVWDTIFQDLDPDHVDKVMCAADSAQGEVTWYFPSISGGLEENDMYVKLNTETGEWDYGTADQTAWIDMTVLGAPIGAHADGDWHQHSEGYNAGDSALASMAETGYFDISEGDQIMFLDRIVPDFVLMGVNPTLNLYINTVEEPNDTPVTHGPFAVTASTREITVRARARQMSLKIESTAIDTWWRLGRVRVRVAPDGRRS